MNNLMLDIIRFQTVMENVVRFKRHDFISLDPETRNQQLNLAFKLVSEEYEELNVVFEQLRLLANTDGSSEEWGRELAFFMQEGLDTIYVIMVAFTIIGLSASVVPAWKELLDNNLSKLDPVTGKPIRNETGKVIKPEGFKKIDWISLLKELENG